MVTPDYAAGENACVLKSGTTDELRGMHPVESRRSLWQRIYPVIIDHDSLNKLETGSRAAVA